MNVKACEREQEVMAAVMGGRWPDGGDADLAAHVAGCGVCREVAEVATAMRTDYRAGFREARVPTAAHVWWRAQIRARQEAARTVARPMTIAQGFGAASAAGVAAAAVALGWRSVTIPDLWGAPPPGLAGDAERSSYLWEWATAVIDQMVAMTSGMPEATLLLAAIVTGLMLMPVAVYFALSEKP